MAHLPQLEGMEAFIHDIKLPGDDEFSRRFNYVSDLWEKFRAAEPESEEQTLAFDAWFDAKYCLEQGLPL